MNTPQTFQIITLGCKINQYESQSLRESWVSKGCQETHDPSQADFVLFNSCAVTAHAVSDLRAQVRRTMRANPKARLIITGCAAQVLAKDLSKAFPEADIVPQSRKNELLEQPLLKEELTLVPAQTTRPSYPEFRVKTYNRVRAVVKVQDGCTHRCTYCIIPSTRGRSVSRSMAEATSEVKRLFEAGWCEVVLSGINLRQYGRDLDPKQDFWDLLNHMEQELAQDWADKSRLRLSSLDPGQLNDKALATIRDSRLLCPQLHISLQSLSPSVLQRMGRGHYNPDEVLAWLENLQAIWPVFGLGTDLIAGFPGETDQEFEQTLQYVSKLPLSYAHVFPYSQRPGTKAATLPQQLPKEIKKQRAKALRDMTNAKKQVFIESLVKLPELRIVQEGTGKGACEFYTECRLTNDKGQPPSRSLLRVRPLQANPGHLLVKQI